MVDPSSIDRPIRMIRYTICYRLYMNRLFAIVVVVVVVVVDDVVFMFIGFCTLFA